MLSKRILILAFVVAFLLLLVGCFPGITPSPPKGVIGGRIMAPPGPETTKDITGWIPLANATVTITDSEGVTHTVTTDENGYYSFTGIAVDANTIITATGTVDGNTVVVKDVVPQAVAADEDYEAGIADAESTALALIIEELLEQGLDPGDIDLEGIQASDNFNEVVKQVNSILEANGNVTTDPGLTNTVGNVAEDIINPPEPTPEPTPQPTPVFLTSIVVDPKTMTLFVGETEDIVSVTAHYSDGSTFVLGQPGYDCGYGSDDPSIAEVSITGLVTAIGVGTTTITVGYEDKTDTLEVTVNPVLLDYIAVAPTEMTLFVGDTGGISVAAYYNYGNPTIATPDCTYSSSDPSIAIVIETLDKREVEAKDFGTATITVSYEVGVITKTATIEVTVIGPVQNLNTNGYYDTIQVAIDTASAGDTIEVSAGTYDEQVVIDKSLTLQGVGDTTIIQPSEASILTTVKITPWISSTKPMAAIVFIDAATEVVVRDLKIDGSLIATLPPGIGSNEWVTGLAYLETSGSVERVAVEGYPQLGTRACGIWTSAVTDAALVEVTGCSVIGYNRGSIYACGGTLTVDFNHNEIYGPGEIVSQVPNGMFFLEGATGSATYNTITDLAYTGETYRSTGIGTYRPGPNLIFGYNEIYNVQNAFAIAGGSGATIEYNDIHGCHTGVKLEAILPDHARNVMIQYNDIRDNDFAIRCGGDMGDGNEAHYNNFVGNSGTEWIWSEDTWVGAVCNIHETYSLDAINNWWGDESGPTHASNPSGAGDTVSDNVVFVPFSTEEN